MSFFQTLIPSLNRTTAPVQDSGNTETAPTVKPAFDIKEAAAAYAVTVHLPGVTKEGLSITAEDGQVRIFGQRAWQRPETWNSFYRESSDYAFELVLTHDNAINADAIAAELRDGVLRLTLPKVEAAKPRKIAIN